MRSVIARIDRALPRRAAVVLVCAGVMGAAGIGVRPALGEIYLGGRGNSFGGPTSNGTLPAPSTYLVTFEFASTSHFPPAATTLAFTIPLGTPVFTQYNVTSGPAFDAMAAELTNGTAIALPTRFYLGWAYWNAGGALNDTSEHNAFFLPGTQVDFAGYTITRFELTLEHLSVIVNGNNSDTNVQTTLRVYGNPVPGPGGLGVMAGVIGVGGVWGRRRR